MLYFVQDAGSSRPQNSALVLQASAIPKLVLWKSRKRRVCVQISDGRGAVVVTCLSSPILPSAFLEHLQEDIQLRGETFIHSLIQASEFQTPFASAF